MVRDRLDRDLTIKDGRAALEATEWRTRAATEADTRGRFRTGSAFLAPLYALYTWRLRGLVLSQPLPCHVAVILDGNRRWAALAGLHEPGAGHRRGAETLGELIGWCARAGIGEPTVWALSTENLSRPVQEVSSLAEVLAQELAALSERAAQGAPPFRIRVFGRLDSLVPVLAETALRVQEETAENGGLSLSIALGYSGRDELPPRIRHEYELRWSPLHAPLRSAPWQAGRSGQRAGRRSKPGRLRPPLTTAAA